VKSAYRLNDKGKQLVVFALIKTKVFRRLKKLADGNWFARQNQMIPSTAV
jgi:hypothetical protein